MIEVMMLHPCSVMTNRLEGLMASFLDEDVDTSLFAGSLGGVDKFEPVSGGGEMDHAEEAVGQLVIAGGDGAVDFEVTEHALDAVALPIERPIVFDLDAAD